MDVNKEVLLQYDTGIIDVTVVAFFFCTGPPSFYCMRSWQFIAYHLSFWLVFLIDRWCELFLK